MAEMSNQRQIKLLDHFRTPGDLGIHPSMEFLGCLKRVCGIPDEWTGPRTSWRPDKKGARMEVKLIEIRDDGTFIPAMAIQLEATNGNEDYLLGRAGFGHSGKPRAGPLGGPWVVMVPLENLSGTTYSCLRGNRTYDTIHQYLAQHWGEVESGQVLDVEFILGEVKEPKRSEADQDFA